MSHKLGPGPQGQFSPLFISQFCLFVYYSWIAMHTLMRWKLQCWSLIITRGQNNLFSYKPIHSTKPLWKQTSLARPFLSCALYLKFGFSRNLGVPFKFTSIKMEHSWGLLIFHGRVLTWRLLDYCIVRLYTKPKGSFNVISLQALLFIYVFIYLSFRAEGEIREQTVSVHSQFEQQIEELFVWRIGYSRSKTKQGKKNRALFM